MTAAAGSSSAQSPAQAVPAIGGFSLEKLYEERQNVAGDRNDPRQQSLADAFAPRSARRRPQQPEPVFEDAVKAGIVPEEQVPGLFSLCARILTRALLSLVMADLVSDAATSCTSTQ